MECRACILSQKTELCLDTLGFLLPDRQSRTNILVGYPTVDASRIHYFRPVFASLEHITIISIGVTVILCTFEFGCPHSTSLSSPSMGTSSTRAHKNSYYLYSLPPFLPQLQPHILGDCYA